MKPSKAAYKAAKDIYKRYEMYLGEERHGNQDTEACIDYMASVISRHCDGTPEWLSEALNSGDGVYRP